MDLEVLCKLAGVIFFIVMCWYFVFVVFKTNSEFLRSVVYNSKSDDFVSPGLSQGLVEGFSGIREGFEGDELTALENKLESLNTFIASLKKKIQLDDDGKSEQLELLKNILKKQIEYYEIAIISGLTTDPKALHEEQSKKIVNAQAYLDAMKEAYENFEKYESEKDSLGY